MCDDYDRKVYDSLQYDFLTFELEAELEVSTQSLNFPRKFEYNWYATLIIQKVWFDLGKVQVIFQSYGFFPISFIDKK